MGRSPDTQYGSRVPIVLGVLASFLIGVSDTLGRSAAKRASGVSHVSTAMLIGSATALVASLALGGEIIAKDMLLGAVSGLLVATALTQMYEGMAKSSSAIVSPIAAVFAALVPLLWDIAGGARPSGLALLGCAVAILSLVLTTLSPVLGTAVRVGVTYGVVSGVLFGISVATVGDTSEASRAWPAVSQRSVGFVAMAVWARVQGVPILLPAKIRRLGWLSGLIGTLGVVSFVVGAQRGNLGEVSVAASMFPAVVVVLSTIFDDDHLRWWQGVGVAGAIAGTALIALG